MNKFILGLFLTISVPSAFAINASESHNKKCECPSGACFQDKSHPCYGSLINSGRTRKNLNEGQAAKKSGTSKSKTVGR